MRIVFGLGFLLLAVQARAMETEIPSYSDLESKALTKSEFEPKEFIDSERVQKILVKLEESLPDTFPAGLRKIIAEMAVSFPSPDSSPNLDSSLSLDTHPEKAIQFIKIWQIGKPNPSRDWDGKLALAVDARQGKKSFQGESLMMLVDGRWRHLSFSQKEGNCDSAILEYNECRKSFGLKEQSKEQFKADEKERLETAKALVQLRGGILLPQARGRPQSTWYKNGGPFHSLRLLGSQGQVLLELGTGEKYCWVLYQSRRPVRGRQGWEFTLDQPSGTISIRPDNLPNGLALFSWPAAWEE